MTYQNKLPDPLRRTLVVQIAITLALKEILNPDWTEQNSDEAISLKDYWFISVRSGLMPDAKGNFTIQLTPTEEIELKMLLNTFRGILEASLKKAQVRHS